jgi:hypothetical protein
MPWHAKPGCAEHHRAAVERIVNAFPPRLQPPQTGELFDGLEHCNRRLCGYALAEGFDIVRKGEGTKVNPRWRFRSLFYGEKTRNDRKLELRVERGQDGTISSKRQGENTNVCQLECEWEAHCSFKKIKNGTRDKRYMLTMNYDTYKGHELADDLFQFIDHLKSLKEFYKAFHQTK